MSDLGSPSRESSHVSSDIVVQITLMVRARKCRLVKSHGTTHGRVLRLRLGCAFPALGLFAQSSHGCRLGGGHRIIRIHENNPPVNLLCLVILGH